MEKRKYYPNVKFGPEAIKEALAVFKSIASAAGDNIRHSILTVDFGGERWSYDTDEEFFSDCRKECKRYSYHIYAERSDLDINFSSETCEVSVKEPSRNQIEAIFEILEKHVPCSSIPELHPPDRSARPAPAAR